MIFWILPMVSVVFMIGAIDLAVYQSSSVLSKTQEVSAQVSGQQFIAYRNAINEYVAAHPGFTGTVSTANLSIPYGFTLPFATGNRVVKTPSGNGQIVIVWANIPQSALFSADLGIRGDLSLGFVGSAGQWISPVTNSVSPIPAGISVPAGNSVSVIQIGV